MTHISDISCSFTSPLSTRTKKQEQDVRNGASCIRLTKEWISQRSGQVRCHRRESSALMNNLCLLRQDDRFESGDEQLWAELSSTFHWTTLKISLTREHTGRFYHQLTSVSTWLFVQLLQSVCLTDKITDVRSTSFHVWNRMENARRIAFSLFFQSNKEFVFSWHLSILVYSSIEYLYTESQHWEEFKWARSLLSRSSGE